MTTTRRHPGVPPRRHRGVVVVHPFNADAEPEAQKPLSNQAKNAGVATGSRNWGARERVTLGRHLRHFNADRLTAALCGLKHETDSGNQIGAQESAALAGGRRPHPSRSLAGDCFTYAGLERDSSHVPRCDGAFAGACPHSLRWHESELERRNRDLLAAGFPVMRFTGSEIFKDPLACAEQVREVASETLFRVSKAAACSDG